MCVVCHPSHHHEVAARESAPSNGYLRVAVFLDPYLGIGISKLWVRQGYYLLACCHETEAVSNKEKRRVVYPALSGLEKQTRLKQTITCCNLRQGVVRKRSKIKAYFSNLSEGLPQEDE